MFVQFNEISVPELMNEFICSLMMQKFPESRFQKTESVSDRV